MRSLLHLLPNPIPVHIQTTATKEADIVHELAEGKKPVLCPHRPGLCCGRRLWRVPPGNADHGTCRQADISIALAFICGASYLGDGNGAAAVDTISEMSSERGCVSLDVKLSDPLLLDSISTLFVFTLFFLVCLSQSQNEVFGWWLEEQDGSYLRWIIKRPAKIGIIGERFLHTVYSPRYVGLSQRDDFD